MMFVISPRISRTDTDCGGCAESGRGMPAIWRGSICADTALTHPNTMPNVQAIAPARRERTARRLKFLTTVLAELRIRIVDGRTFRAASRRFRCCAARHPSVPQPFRQIALDAL